MAKKTTKKVEKKEIFKGWKEVMVGNVLKLQCPHCGGKYTEAQLRSNYECRCPNCGQEAEET